MSVLSHVQHGLERSRLALAARVQPGDDRGDVVGWVLIAVMTCGLVTALWAAVDGQLNDLFTQALDGVTGP